MSLQDFQNELLDRLAQHSLTAVQVLRQRALEGHLLRGGFYDSRFDVRCPVSTLEVIDSNRTRIDPYPRLAQLWDDLTRPSQLVYAYPIAFCVPVEHAANQMLIETCERELLLRQMPSFEPEMNRYRAEVGSLTTCSGT